MKPVRKRGATGFRGFSRVFPCKDANSAITSVNRPRRGLTDPSRDYGTGGAAAKAVDRARANVVEERPDGASHQALLSC